MAIIQFRYRPTPPDPYDSSAEWQARNQARNTSYNAADRRQLEMGEAATEQKQPQAEAKATPTEPPRFNHLTGQRIDAAQSAREGNTPVAAAPRPVLPDMDRYGVMRRGGIDPSTGQERPFVGVGAGTRGNRTFDSFEGAREFSQGDHAAAGISLPYVPASSNDRRGFSQDGQRDVQWTRTPTAPATATPAPNPATAAATPNASASGGTPPSANQLAPALSIKGAGQRLGQGIAAAATERGPHNPFDFVDTAERFGTAALGAAWDGSWNVPQRGLIRQGIEAAVDNPVVRNVGSAIGDAQAQNRQQAAIAAGRIAPDFNARAAAAQQKYFPQLPEVKPAATPVNSLVAVSGQATAPRGRGIQPTLPDIRDVNAPAKMEIPKPNRAQAAESMAMRRLIQDRVKPTLPDANDLPSSFDRQPDPFDFPTLPAAGPSRPSARLAVV